MINAAIKYVDAICILMLLSEVHSLPLLVLGWVMVVGSVFIGSLSGWLAARR